MQALPMAGVVPVHHQIANELRDQIISGDLAPGDPVPTIAELAAQWNCAPGSARAALAVLREEGRITAGRGKAARVRTPPVRTPLVLSPEWSQIQKDMVLRTKEERARKGAIELTAGIPIDETELRTQYDRVLSDQELAREFELPVGTELVRREYEMTTKAAGNRVSWSVSYIPLHLIESNKALLDASNEPWPGGHHHQLYTVGIEIDRFVRTLTAVQPTPGDRQTWGMEQGVALLSVRSKSIDTRGRVVELSDATYPADRTEITFTEQLKRWTDEQLSNAAAGDE